MRLLTLAVVGGVVCAGSLHVLSGGATPLAFGQAAATRTPTVAAVVNLQVLLEGLRELSDKNKELDPTRSGYRAQLDELDTRIKALEVELKDNVSPDQAMLRAEKSLQLAELRNVREFREKSFIDLMDARNGDILRRIYIKTLPQIATYAKLNGIDLVLLDDRGIPVPERANQSQINNVILSKRVLHASEAIDITQQLITYVNNEYGAAPAAAPAP
jgi:Skp family chaperone for outer membrane proteins